MLTYEKFKNECFLLFYSNDKIKNDVNFKLLAQYCKCDSIDLIDEALSNHLGYLLRNYQIIDYDKVTVKEGETLSVLTEENAIKFCDLINMRLVTSKLSDEKVYPSSNDELYDVLWDFE